MRCAGDPVSNSCSLRLAENESELSDSENRWGKQELIASESRIGSGPTSPPGFSLSVPRMNSAFLGLMQNSSTLILLLVTMPWRARKLSTFAGAGSLVVKNESQNCC